MQTNIEKLRQRRGAIELQQGFWADLPLQMPVLSFMAGNRPDGNVCRAELSGQRIGSSTRSEIEYAKANGKAVNYCSGQ